MYKTMTFSIGALFLMTLYGCGSGGGDTTQAAIDPNLTVPVSTAFAQIANSGLNQSFTISGSIDQSTSANPIPPTPITGSGNLTLGAGSAATLDGAAVLHATQVITGAIIADGQNTPIGIAGNVYYNPSDFTTAVSDFPGEYTVYSAHTYPATVKAGNTGSPGSGTKYSDSSRTSAVATITDSYTVASDSPTSLLVTFIASVHYVSSFFDHIETVYRIDTSGNVSLVSSTTRKYGLCCVGGPYQTLIFTF